MGASGAPLIFLRLALGCDRAPRIAHLRMVVATFPFLFAVPAMANSSLILLPREAVLNLLRARRSWLHLPAAIVARSGMIGLLNAGSPVSRLALWRAVRSSIPPSCLVLPPESPSSLSRTPPAAARHVALLRRAGPLDLHVKASLAARGRAALPPRPQAQGEVLGCCPFARPPLVALLCLLGHLCWGLRPCHWRLNFPPIPVHDWARLLRTGPVLVVSYGSPQRPVTDTGIAPLPIWDAHFSPLPNSLARGLYLSFGMAACVPTPGATRHPLSPAMSGAAVRMCSRAAERRCVFAGRPALSSSIPSQRERRCLRRSPVFFDCTGLPINAPSLATASSFLTASSSDLAPTGMSSPYCLGLCPIAALNATSSALNSISAAHGVVATPNPGLVWPALRSHLTAPLGW